MTPVTPLRPARPDGHDDDASVLEASRTDPELFAVIFDRHEGAISRYVTRRLGPMLAEDVVADTFATAFAVRHRYDTSRADARPWLYGIATNLVRRQARTEVRQYRMLARTGVDPALNGFDQVATDRLAAQAQRRALARALARLTAGQRDALLLVVWGGLSHDEAASALAVPPGTVRSRVFRARQRLRAMLTADGVHEGWSD